MAFKPYAKEGAVGRKDERCPRGDSYVPEVEGECDPGYKWNPKTKRCECEKKKGFFSFFTTTAGMLILIASAGVLTYGAIQLAPAAGSPSGTKRKK